MKRAVRRKQSRLEGRQSVSIKDQVYDSLKWELLAGGLRAGDFLQEQQLADRFGVSKTPIREALGTLVDQGLIQLLPRKGYWVAPVSSREILECIDLRIILECAAVELAVQRITETELRELEKLILPHASDGRKLVDQALVAKYGRNNILFHSKIGEASGNLTLARVMTSLLEKMTRAIFVSYSFPEIEETASDHKLIVDALRAGNSSEAQALVKRHLQVTRLRLMKAALGGEADTKSA
jgi:DNA-binding GntR family transcriptional regulator